MSSQLMNRNKLLLFFLFIYGMSSVIAQVSPDCVNAIPICNDTPVNGGTNGFGDDDFNGMVTSGCLEQTLEGTIESNSAWYRFRTGASGQLGFNIGIDTNEDWDFALYRTDDCNNLGEPVRCNFFDNQDENAFVGVGEDPSGNTSNVQYEDWLQVEPGEDYYLLINNFSNNNSGFSIQFSGHIFVTNPFDALDCSIIDNLLGSPISACEGDNIVLDADTSDAITYNWFIDTGAGFDPIIGENNSTLQVVNSAFYRVEVVRAFGNIYSDVQVYFSTRPVSNIVSDDASCTGLDVYNLGQKDDEALGSQSNDDFLVSYYLSQSDAVNAENVLRKEYEAGSGSQTIYVRVTSIDNPKCFDVSQSFQLINLTTPVLDFSTQAYLCQEDSGVTIGEDQPDSNLSYSWDNGETTPTIIITQEGEYTLEVTNTQSGLSCSDSRTITVTNSRPPQIVDIQIDDIQNNNTITVVTGEAGDVEFQLDDHPFQEGNKFYQVQPGLHTVTVNDPNGCGAVSEDVIVVGFPKFFTPNSDGSNDFWHIEGIETLESPIVHIYDRFGKLLAQLNSTSQGWDGSINGKPLPETDYWFKLTYTDVNGQTVTAKYINNHFALKR
ncbi:gliding motility-associated-like protein [Flavobacteriaceae bacterium MAR_2009_75]|nr:gliding motility-associated-like protein [Flavobacteriaceae bacterium MAR_2009_75]